jgi:2-haloacid dehalogenase
VRQVAVFDAYGTLFDTQALAESAEAQFPGRGAELVRVWRAKQLEYTWLRSLMGRYEDFWAVTRASLEFACEALDLPLSGPARDRLLEEFLRVPAFPDAPPALSQLRARGVRCCVFSNGTRAMVEAAVSSAGLGAYVDAVLSVDEEVRVYKPHPAAYAYVCRRLGIQPPQAVFVSSNGFDVAGAAAYGFPAAWVNRRGLPAERLGATPALVVQDLLQLAAAWV